MSANKTAAPDPVRRYLVVAFVATAVAVVAGGFEYFRFEQRHIKSERFEALASVAELKIEQIGQWRAERLLEVQRVAEAPFLRDAVAEWEQGGFSPADHGRFQERLRNELGPGFVDALFLALDGSVLATGRERAPELPPETVHALRELVTAGRPVLSELFTNREGRVCLDAVATLHTRDGRRPLVHFVKRSDANEYLFPVVRQWPTPSLSAETLLIRREGDELLYLNELRHHAGPALRLRLSVEDTDLPAAGAIRGARGRFEGLDYRGEPVLAYLDQVPDSNWFLVAKLDLSEVLAAARDRTAVIGLITLLLLLLAAAGSTFVYRQRQAGLYRNLYHFEKRQREEREMFRTILYSIGDGVITTDQRGAVEMVNPVAANLTGWSEDEARGRAFEEIFQTFDQVSRANAVSPVTRVLQENRIIKLAEGSMLRARNGAERPVAESGAPIRAEGGAISGVVVVFRDQTDERAAEQAIRESEARFRHLADAMPQLVWTATADGRVDYYNQRYREYEGIQPLRNGFAWQPVLHPDDRAATLEAWTRALQTGAVYQVEHRVRLLNGTFRWLLSRGVPVRNEAGEITRWFGTATDIEDLKTAQRELRDSEARYRELFENMSEGFAIGEPIPGENGRADDFRLIEVNAAFERESGLPRAIVGRPIREALPRIEQYWFDTYLGVVASGRPVSFTRYNQDTARHFEVFCFRPRPGCFAVMFRNVNQRVQAEAELRRTMAELKRSNADLEHFAFAASHDLKSPLRAIDSLSQWLDEDLRDRLDPEHAGHLRLLRQRAQRMGRLLDDLLEYARAGRAGNAEQVDVYQLVAQARELLSPPEGMRVEIEEPLPVVTAPVAPLRQVFVNLLGNAIKHHDRATGRVVVSARREDEWVEFTVADDGPGVPPEYREKVFEMFQTLRPRDEVEGSGMGLALVRRIVESAGGSVVLEGAGKRGAVVRFRWPHRMPATRAGETHRQPPSPPPDA